MSEDKRNASVVSAATHRHRSVAEEHVTSVLGLNEVPIIDKDLSADDEVLAALGYMYVQHRSILRPVILLTVVMYSDPSSRENSHCGQHFASVLPSWVYYQVLPRHCTMEWDMQGQQAWYE